MAAKKRIHVPSLVADSRHAFFDNREEEEELVTTTAEHVEVVLEDEESRGDDDDGDDTGEIPVVTEKSANGTGAKRPRRSAKAEA